MAASRSGHLFHIALVYPPPQQPQHGLCWAKPVWWACCSLHYGIGKDWCRSLCSPWCGCRELGSTWLSLEGPLEVSAVSPCADTEQGLPLWHTEMEYQCCGVQRRAALGTLQLLATHTLEQSAKQNPWRWRCNSESSQQCLPLHRTTSLVNGMKPQSATLAPTVLLLIPTQGLLQGFSCQQEHLSQYGCDNGSSSPSLAGQKWKCACCMVADLQDNLLAPWWSWSCLPACTPSSLSLAPCWISHAPGMCGFSWSLCPWSCQYCCL